MGNRWSQGATNQRSNDGSGSGGNAWDIPPPSPIASYTFEAGLPAGLTIVNAVAGAITPYTAMVANTYDLTPTVGAPARLRVASAGTYADPATIQLPMVLADGESMTVAFEGGNGNDQSGPPTDDDRLGVYCVDTADPATATGFGGFYYRSEFINVAWAAGTVVGTTGTSRILGTRPIVAISRVGSTLYMYAYDANSGACSIPLSSFPAAGIAALMIQFANPAGNRSVRSMVWGYKTTTDANKRGPWTP